jgi:hypothetical protein
MDRDRMPQQYTAEKRDIDHLDCPVCFFTHGLKTEIDKRIITFAHQLCHTDKEEQYIKANGHAVIQRSRLVFC